MKTGALTPQWLHTHTLLRGIAFCTVITLGGCKRLPGDASMPENATPCPKQRPETCTMEYKPVIGYTAEGEDRGVFSNHCAACREEGMAWTLPKDERE